MGLQLKFNLILAVCYLLGLGLSLYFFYQLSRREAMEQLQSQIDVLRAEALSVRKYTSDEIRPLLTEQNTVQFLPQTIPSFSAHTVFRNFREYYPQFSYKEAVLNPTNPSDLPDDWERGVIDDLQKSQPERDMRIRTTDGTDYYTAAYPLVIKDAGCLACHSTPEKAPPSMVALYGSKNGFGWKQNDMIGAQIISVPMSIAESKLWRDLTWFVGTSSSVFLGLLILIDLLLYWLVLGPVKRMAEVAEKVSMGDSDVPEYEHPRGDEIGTLSQSFNRMRRSLDSALKMLEK
jgi:protein-histidine pros-kinase